MKISRFKVVACFFVFAAALVMSVPLVKAQKKMDAIDKQRMKSMLKGIKNAVKKDYYDEKFHGIDIEARFQQAEEKLDQVTTTGQSLGVIAQVLMDFNDSHLYFLPPSTNLTVEYGWRMLMLGDKCFVTAVKPKSNAEAVGLKPGDQILSVEGFKPTRKEMWKVNYYYNILSKRQNLKLVVLSPGSEQPRELQVESKITQQPSTIVGQNAFRLNEGYSDTKNDEHIFQKIGNLTIWRMPSFAIEPSQVDMIMNAKIGKMGGLILDLRSNGGGYVKTLERLAGFLFEKDLKIADLKGRKTMEPIFSKTRGQEVFKGKIIVLISSESGSASEILARVVQLEKRGEVIGDVSAGAVMQATSFDGETGSGTFGTFFGASITNADVIMSDGKTVEHVGVVPDILMLPTSEDIANGRDPVLSKAVEMLGGSLTPIQAGRFAQYDWGNK